MTREVTDEWPAARADGGAGPRAGPAGRPASTTPAARCMKARATARRPGRPPPSRAAAAAARAPAAAPWPSGGGSSGCGAARRAHAAARVSHHRLADALGERLRGEGLHEEGVRAGVERLLHGAQDRVGRDHHDAHGAQVLVGADAPDELEPISGPAGRWRAEVAALRPQADERLGAAAGLDHAPAGALERALLECGASAAESSTTRAFTRRSPAARRRPRPRCGGRARAVPRPGGSRR